MATADVRWRAPQVTQHMVRRTESRHWWAAMNRRQMLTVTVPLLVLPLTCRALLSQALAQSQEG